MQIGFDENLILSIKDKNLPELKPYHYQLSGYRFGGYDRWIFVYHKRSWKLIQLKNLGEGMQVAYCKNTAEGSFVLHKNMLEQALGMFEGFDEEKGESYHFLPSFSKESQRLQAQFEALDIKVTIEKKQGGTFVSGLNINTQIPETNEEWISFLFALVLIYGKFDEKNGEVSGMKIHLPFIAGAYRWQEALEVGLEKLQAEGILTKWSGEINGANKIFQITSNNPQLLKALLSLWNNNLTEQEQAFSLQLFEQKQNEIKNQLGAFLQKEEFDSYEGIDKLRSDILNLPLQFLR